MSYTSKALIFSCLICFSAVFIAALTFQKHSISKNAFYIVCDVGQGDATLLQLGSFQVLIDAGPSSKVLECLSTFMPKNDTKIEIVVASHADSDHIKGFEAVFTKYLLGEIWLVTLPKKSADFEAFSAAVSRKKSEGTQVRYVEQGDTFVVGKNMTVSVISPRVSLTEKATYFNTSTETTLSASSTKENTREEWGNDRSIVLKIVIYDVSILLTGDVEKNTEQALLARGLIDQVDILKIAHHGSKTSSTLSFLTKAQPELATVSSGINNKFGHPSAEVIANLMEKRTKILRTDQLSHIVLEISEEGKILERKKQ